MDVRRKLNVFWLGEKRGFNEGGDQTFSRVSESLFENREREQQKEGGRERYYQIAWRKTLAGNRLIRGHHQLRKITGGTGRRKMRKVPSRGKGGKI